MLPDKLRLSNDRIPEHAAAGLWSTPTDLANLLLVISRSWRGESSLFLLPETAREMLTPQNGGPMGWAGRSAPRTARRS